MTAVAHELRPQLLDAAKIDEVSTEARGVPVASAAGCGERERSRARRGE